MDFSDEQLVKKLREAKAWKAVHALSIPFFVVGGFAAVAYCASLEAWLAMLLSAGTAFALMFVLFTVANKQVRKSKQLLGECVTRPILEELFEIEDYSPNARIGEGIIRAARLIDDWDRASGSDYIEGKYKGYGILYSDILLEREETGTDDGGKRTKKWVKVFKGQWMICDFGREFPASLRLLERRGGKFFGTHDLSKSSIETESEAFNKKFRILTGDGHTAFYILTPHFMERLTAMDEAADAQTFLCFSGGKVTIALNSNRDSFELKGVKLNHIEAVREKFRAEIQRMTGILDELMQNQTLFQEVK
jgi:hypothetical protein